MSQMSDPDDPRWEWINVATLTDNDEWLRGCCTHLNVVPVRQAVTLGGAVVAHLCTTCDTQLPSEWRHPDAPND